ncbi:uncharacterized protein MYCFIDRAFT_217059 [Pseudocercospora fijiensis CIRAD86]|uniref:Uncharacterized protein n=1 Tax=Pseudocercospora fijiensis (strain CIRAD86) TaxID=383855 RepID=M3AJM2_PSEFD|nr:uncharacterized protein MYCFIDRAFT_217059 [Pseudocercospora fijiensis CIRAD86]EME77368.1 hypothetical protein MYCFIDRAFT_217059 [Pseudocercospora fijiensis CIRAD86]
MLHVMIVVDSEGVMSSACCCWSWSLAYKDQPAANVKDVRFLCLQASHQSQLPSYHHPQCTPPSFSSALSPLLSPPQKLALHQSLISTKDKKSAAASPEPQAQPTVPLAAQSTVQLASSKAVLEVRSRALVLRLVIRLRLPRRRLIPSLTKLLAMLQVLSAHFRLLGLLMRRDFVLGDRLGRMGLRPVCRQRLRGRGGSWGGIEGGFRYGSNAVVGRLCGNSKVLPRDWNTYSLCILFSLSLSNACRRSWLNDYAS